MLSQAQMVKARKAIEMLYVGTCTITERKKVQKENKTKGFEDVIVLKDQPCKLSYNSNPQTSKENGVASVSQVIKVFLAPEIIVKAGSKMSITQYGRTTDYKSSGQPAVYGTHQEITLELFDGWA